MLLLLPCCTKGLPGFQISSLMSKSIRTVESARCTAQPSSFAGPCRLWGPRNTRHDCKLPHIDMQQADHKEDMAHASRQQGKNEAAGQSYRYHTREKVAAKDISPYLATGVRASSPVDSDRLRHIQLLFQLLNHSLGPVLGLNDGNTAKLSPSARHQPSGQVARVDLEPAGNTLCEYSTVQYSAEAFLMVTASVTLELQQLVCQ